jgi:hypothetical protein
VSKLTNSVDCTAAFVDIGIMAIAAAMAPTAANLQNLFIRVSPVQVEVFSNVTLVEAV